MSKAQLAAYALRAVRAAERIRMPPITRGAAYSVVALFVVTFLLAGLNLLFTAHEVGVSQHTWCQTLNLLTSHPVPKPANPAANPSRVRAYQFYEVFVQQRQRLGCG